ncbi:hypothetical protein [Streptomyces sp. NPDC051135]|uniref:hypothetical protein n=1 Tax=unclassified Streptomyces TaxID=2593676 RepID=UPI003424D5E7
MSRRHVRKMLRQMASGEPVEVTLAMATMKKLSRLAFIAQQFGYGYADIRQGGPQGNGFVMLIVPDPGPQARARAAENWARYPNASDGGALPPLVPEEVELLKARITFDITAMYTDRQRILLTGVGAVPLAVPIGFALGTGTTAVVLAGAVWAGLMALLPVGFAVNRHFRAKYAALLRAAGFTQVTDQTGRSRYVPPGGQLPGTSPECGPAAFRSGPATG